jgi:hypothetical protein
MFASYFAKSFPNCMLHYSCPSHIYTPLTFYALLFNNVIYIKGGVYRIFCPHSIINSSAQIYCVSRSTLASNNCYIISLCLIFMISFVIVRTYLSKTDIQVYIIPLFSQRSATAFIIVYANSNILSNEMS